MQPEVHIISCGPLIPSAIVVNFKTDSNHRYSFILAGFLLVFNRTQIDLNRYNLVLEIVITNTCILPLLIISFCFMKIYIGCPPPSLALKNPSQSEINRFILKREKIRNLFYWLTQFGFVIFPGHQKYRGAYRSVI